MLCARACEGKKRDKKTYHDGDIGHEEKDGFIHRYCDSDEQAWCNKNELDWTITGLVLVSAAQGERVGLTVAAVIPYGFPLPLPEPMYHASIPITKPAAVPP